MDASGNIKSLYKTATGFRKCFPDKDGYLKFASQDLSRKTHNAFIHRLFYMTWVGEIPPGLTVDHIDGNKLNNHHSNLQLLSAGDNARKGAGAAVRFISPTGDVVNVFNMYDFCREHGLIMSEMHKVQAGVKYHRKHRGWTKYE